MVDINVILAERRKALLLDKKHSAFLDVRQISKDSIRSSLRNAGILDENDNITKLVTTA